MSCYVDPVTEYPQTRLRWKRWSHLFGDTPEELHAMAERIGLKREWFQDHDPRPGFHHYDVTPSKRAAAVRLGAVPISTRDYLKRVRNA